MLAQMADSTLCLLRHSVRVATVHWHSPKALNITVVQDMRIAWEEPFGPVIPVIRVKTIDDAIDHCNSNNLALQARSYTKALVCYQIILHVWETSNCSER